jgi:YD repeat-containing protein
MKSHKLYYFFIFFLVPFKVQGQESFAVQTPNAASQFTLNEVPLNCNTGLPNIQLPLYTLTEGSLSVPLTLTYNVGSIKPNTQPGWVGLGWSLVPQGCITRQVVSLYDEQWTYGWAFSKNKSTTLELAGNSFAQNNDGVPDVFFYNCGNYSGKFYFDDYDNIKSTPNSDVVISVIEEDNGTYPGDNRLVYLDDPFNGNSSYLGFIGFIITTPDGTKYEFREREQNYPQGIRALLTEVRASTWYLTKITSVDNTHFINFAYDKPATNKYFFQTDYNPFQTNLHYEGALYNDINHYNSSLNQLKYLRSIQTSSGQTLEFVFSEKNDLAYNIGTRYNTDNFNIPTDCNFKCHKLDIINVKYNGITKFKYLFNYTPYNSTKPEKLKLLSISKMSGDNTATQQLYSFIYSPEIMKYSFEYVNENGQFISNTDSWGYLKIPYRLDYRGYCFDINGRNPRDEIYFDTIFADLLLKINYPTGGSTSFTYETNTFSHVSNDPSYQCKKLAMHHYSRGWNEFNDILNGAVDPINISINDDIHFYVKIVFDMDGNFATYDDRRNACYCNNVDCNIDVRESNGYSGTLNRILFNALTTNIPYVSGKPDNYGCRDITRNKFIFPVNDVPSEDGIPYSMDVYYYTLDNVVNEYSSGVRVKAISNFDNITGQTITKTYNYVLEDGVTSSGVIASQPQLKYSGKVNFIEHGCPNGASCWTKIHLNEADLLENSSNPVVPVSLTGGSHIAYSRVEEVNSDNSKKVLYYTGFSNYPDVYYKNQRYIDRSEFRGKLSKEEYFLVGQTTPIKTIIYSYPQIIQDEDPAHAAYIRLQKLGNVTGKNTNSFGLFYVFVPTNYFPENIRLSGKTTVENGVTTVENYTYNIKYQVSSSSLQNNNLNQVTKILYSTDYQNITSGFIKEMQTANVINQPIEQYTLVNSKVTKGSITTYKSGNYFGLLDVTYSLETATPLTLITNFKPSNTDNSFSSSSIYTPNSYYKKDVTFDFYSNGNLTQLHKENDINVSCYYAYNNSLPVVKASYTTKDILNTQVSNAMTFAGISDISAITKIGTSDTAKLGKYNRYLRYTALPNALITTNTIDPLIGVTSITDERGITTFYEYDKLGRLICIRDRNWRIIQQFAYHYLNQ